MLGQVSPEMRWRLAGNLVATVWRPVAVGAFWSSVSLPLLSVALGVRGRGAVRGGAWRDRAVWRQDPPPAQEFEVGALVIDPATLVRRRGK